MIRKIRKRLLVIGASTVLALSGGTVFASSDLLSYRLGVFLSSKGYEAGRAAKESGSNYARVQVTGSNWINLSTNYIVCQPGSGVQMSQNVIIAHSDSSMHNLPYYSQYVYTGPLTVALRVNSGQTQANYTVWGNWSPNPS